MIPIRIYITVFFALGWLHAISQEISDQDIQLNVAYFENTSSTASGDCHASDLALEGLSELCPEDVTYVDIDGENSFPPGGGQGIRFTNYDNVDFVISGMEFPYSFNSDINGTLSQNGLDPLEGSIDLFTVTFTNSNNVTGSICDESFELVGLYFYSSDENDCENDPCFAQELALTGESTICPGEFSSLIVENPNTIPSGGGQGIRVLIDDGSDVFVPEISFPYSFDNDLNGFLSDNGFNLLEGDFLLGAFVYSDSGDPINSICSQSISDFTITFLPSINPECIDTDCFAQDPVLSGSSAICPMESSSINLVYENTIPENGGQGLKFFDDADIEFIIPGVTFPFVFNGELNGFLANNGIDQIAGSFHISSVVYSDSEDVNGSICSESAESVSIEFIPGDEADCLICETEWMYGGPNSICPGELTTIYTGGSSIPTGGALGLKCVDEEGTEIIIPNILFPYSVDNDLNGFLSENDLDPLEGFVSFSSVVYTNPNDIAGSICSESEFPMVVDFLPSDDISCVPCQVEELENLGAQSLCPDETTELDFTGEISVPNGGGVGLRVEFLDMYTVYFSDVSFPYSVDSDLGGYLSENEIEFQQGWFMFRPFIYVDSTDPENSICTLGEQIEVHFLSSDASSCEPDCNVEDLVLVGPNVICNNESTTVNLPIPGIIPEGGGVGIKFSDGNNVNIFYPEISFPFEVNFDLNGELTDAGFDPFEGEIMLTSFAYANPNNISDECSVSDNPVLITFLEENDPNCTLGINNRIKNEGKWTLFPNPTEKSTNLEIEVQNDDQAFIQIIDLSGREIMNFKSALHLGQNSINIDLSEIQNGLYRVVLKIGASVESKPLVISNNQ